MAAHQISAMPATTDPALASWAFDNPHKNLGVAADKFNQKASYSAQHQVLAHNLARTVPLAAAPPQPPADQQPGGQLVERRGMHPHERRVGSMPLGKLMPQGSFVGIP